MISYIELWLLIINMWMRFPGSRKVEIILSIDSGLVSLKVVKMIVFFCSITNLSE